MSLEPISILILQGPNLNLLGSRQPELYGAKTQEDLRLELLSFSDEAGVKLDFFQSNSEGLLIDRVHEAQRDGTAGVILNAGGLTHTSISLRDAFLGTGLPFVEVHLSNTAAREAFRHVSLFSDIAVGVVSGFGISSYLLGLKGLILQIKASDQR